MTRTHDAPGPVTPTSAPDGSTAGFDSVDPRDGSVIASYPVHDAEQVREKVARARAAARWWADLGFEGRAARLDAWRVHLVRHLDELAGVVSRETGKPVDDARIEIVLAVDHLAWAAKHARRVLGPRSVSAGVLMANQAATLAYPPLGVIGVLGPWNYPVFTPMGSLVYALAAGNAVVFKPSELTPGVGRWLVDSFAAVVGENAVVQLVTGFGETGAALCRAGVDKIAFTGSTATAKKVMATCAETLTPVLMECGGKDALIVDDDADLDAAATATVWGAMSNAGQTCVGVERVYVVDAVAEEFLERVRERAVRTRPAGGAGADYGPITMPEQLGIISSHIEDALARGGRAVVGGTDAVRAPYVGPVVLADVPEDSPAVTDETFGPTVVVNRVRNADEAVARANASRYGLGASVFAGRRARAIAERLRCGMVAVNGVISFAAIPALPFGGIGDSGFGRIHGADGLREFTYSHATARKRFPSLEVMSFDRPRWAIGVFGRLARALHGRARSRRTSGNGPVTPE